MVRNVFGAAALLLLIAFSLISAAGGSLAELDYNYAIDTEISPLAYKLYTMVLEEGASVSVSVISSGGSADIYFLDGHGTSEFLSIVLEGNMTGWAYIDGLSKTNTQSFDQTATVDSEGYYSVAIVNSNGWTITVQGSVASEGPARSTLLAEEDFTLILIFVSAGTIVIVLVVILYVIPRSYRLQAEVDSDARGVLQDELADEPRMTLRGGKCPYCGHKNPDGTMFCASCGEKIV